MAKRIRTRAESRTSLVPAKARIQAAGRTASSKKAASPLSRGRAELEIDRAAPEPRVDPRFVGAQPGGAQLANDQVAASNLSLHDLFQQQARQMLDRADLSEEQKQSILVAMSCPCCGAGGMSFTAKLKRRE
jgi:hypothetical protein